MLAVEVRILDDQEGVFVDEVEESSNSNSSTQQEESGRRTRGRSRRSESRSCLQN